MIDNQFARFASVGVAGSTVDRACLPVSLAMGANFSPVGDFPTSQPRLNSIFISRHSGENNEDLLISVSTSSR